MAAPAKGIASPTASASAPALAPAAPPQDLDDGTLAAIAAALELESRAAPRRRADTGPSPWALAGRLRLTPFRR